MESERPGGDWVDGVFHFLYPDPLPANYVAPFEARCDMWPYNWRFALPEIPEDVPEYAWRIKWPDTAYIEAAMLFANKYRGIALPNLRICRGDFENEYYFMTRVVYVSSLNRRVFFGHITLAKLVTSIPPPAVYDLPYPLSRLVYKAEDVMAAAVRKQAMAPAVIKMYWEGGDFEDRIDVRGHLKRLWIHHGSHLHDACQRARGLLQEAFRKSMQIRDDFHVTFDAIADPCRNPHSIWDILGLRQLRPHELQLQLGVFLQHRDYEEYLWKGALHPPAADIEMDDPGGVAEPSERDR